MHRAWALCCLFLVFWVPFSATAFGQLSWNSKDNQLPETTVGILEQADQFELLGLNPSPLRGGSGFHGHAILEKTEIKDRETRKKLISALMASMRENHGEVAMCFNPRHGIRATGKGGHADLVICFECLQAKLYGDSKGEFLITASPQKLFDEVLKAGHSLKR
jgi:hypothetical protein